MGGYVAKRAMWRKLVAQDQVSGGFFGKKLADRRLLRWPLAGTVHDPEDIDALCGYGVDDQT